MACTTCTFRPAEPLTEFHWSRLASMLRENQTPSSIENQTIAKLEQDVEAYDIEIARLQSVIMSLEYQRDAVRDYVVKHKSLLRPIRRLPNDVLTEIFGRYCSDSPSQIAYEEISLPPLVLTQVCSHWQSLVISAPLLWSNITLNFDNTMIPARQYSDSALIEVVNLLLDRSKGCFLTLEFIYEGMHHHHDIHPALARVFQHSDRWREVLVAAITGLKDELPLSQLQALHIIGKKTAIAVAPSLRSLSLNPALSLWDELRQQDFPWNQLTTLELRSTILSHCASIFSWCTQLRHATLGLNSPEDLSSSQQAIVSQTIVSLTVQGDDISSIDKLFHLAKFSRLQVLSLDGCTLPPSASTKSFVSNSASITTLVFKFLSLNIDDLIQLLRLMPGVNDLTWHQSWDSVTSGTLDDLVSGLCPSHPSDTQTLLPRLTHLDLKVEGPDDPGFSLPHFVKMVKARWVGAQERLKRMRLSLEEHCFDHQLLPPLVYLKKVGMAISLQDECGFVV